MLSFDSVYWSQSCCHTYKKTSLPRFVCIIELEFLGNDTHTIITSVFSWNERHLFDGDSVVHRVMVTTDHHLASSIISQLTTLTSFDERWSLRTHIAAQLVVDISIDVEIRCSGLMNKTMLSQRENRIVCLRVIWLVLFILYLFIICCQLPS